MTPPLLPLPLPACLPACLSRFLCTIRTIMSPTYIPFENDVVVVTRHSQLPQQAAIRRHRSPPHSTPPKPTPPHHTTSHPITHDNTTEHPTPQPAPAPTPAHIAHHVRAALRQLGSKTRQARIRAPRVRKSTHQSLPSLPYPRQYLPVDRRPPSLSPHLPTPSPPSRPTPTAVTAPSQGPGGLHAEDRRGARNTCSRWIARSPCPHLR